MEIKARICKVLPERKGTSEKGQWSFTPVIIEFDEQTMSGVQTHSAKIELSTTRYEIDEIRKLEGKRDQTVEMNLYIKVKQGQNGSFNEVVAYPVSGSFRKPQNYDGF